MCERIFAMKDNISNMTCTIILNLLLILFTIYNIKINKK